MSRNPFYREKFRKPELFFSEVIKKSARGSFVEKDENSRVFFRAVVAAVDVRGGLLENESGIGVVTHFIDGRSIDFRANIGPLNPKNSVKARILTDGFDQFVSDDRLRVFWPFFPEHVSVPVKPGEHVYVLFEDEGFEHGLWFSKVSGHESTNLFRGQDSFRNRSSESLASLFGQADVSQAELDTDLAAGESLSENDRLSSLFGV